MYGGKGKAQLFLVARNGDVADATPVGGGKAYSAQPYAFAYRKSYDRACAGQLQSGIAAPGSSGDDVRVILVDGYNQTAEEGELAGVSWWGR
jgi:hypothetical protein